MVGETKRGKGTKWMVLVDGQGLPLGVRLESASPAEVTLEEDTLVIDDPGRKRMPGGHRRQHLTAHLPQKRIIAPGRIGYDVMQRLVHLPNIARSQGAAIGSTLLRSIGNSSPLV